MGDGESDQRRENVEGRQYVVAAANKMPILHTTPVLANWQPHVRVVQVAFGRVQLKVNHSRNDETAVTLVKLELDNVLHQDPVCVIVDRAATTFANCVGERMFIPLGL
jgi:hypothetical protein